MDDAMYSCISESTTDVPRHDQTLNYRPEALAAVAPDQYDAGCPRAPSHSAPVAIGSIRANFCRQSAANYSNSVLCRILQKFAQILQGDR